jgi:ABC-type glycerol-3-phosphate transport system substrate-binding protein
MVDVWNGALTPASDLFPKSFLDQLNVSKEVRYDGKIWAIPWYTLNWPMVYNKKMFAAAGLNPQDPPARLQQLLEACERLKSSGVTPIGVGTKDGYSFQWFLNNFGLQNFDSLGEMMALFADGDVNDARVKDVFGLLHRLYRAGYYNGNATSLSIYEGNETFKARETAMTICVFPDWIRDMGDEEVGVMYPPVYGTGRLADKSVAVTSQTLGISSWSKKQREAADFLMFFMSKERSPALYAACHAIHARKDFNAGVLETEMERTMHSWIQRFPDNGSAENFFPEKVVYEGFNPAAQLVFSDNYSPEQCMADVEKVVNEWRTLSPAEVDNYRAWSEDLR